MIRRIFASIFSLCILSAVPAWSAPPPPAANIILPMTVYSSATVKDFLAACKTDQGGCLDEVGNALMDKIVLDGTDSICMDSVAYGKPVPGWLASHPQTASLPTEEGIYRALKALYPC